MTSIKNTEPGSAIKRDTGNAKSGQETGKGSPAPDGNQMS